MIMYDIGSYNFEDLFVSICYLLESGMLILYILLLTVN